MQRLTMLRLGLACLLAAPVVSGAQVEELYQARCSSCHGMDGSGSTPAGKKIGAADLRSQQVQKLSDEEMFQTIAYGLKHKQYPHAYVSRGQLTAKQVTDLVAHIRKLAKSK